MTEVTRTTARALALGLLGIGSLLVRPVRAEPKIEIPEECGSAEDFWSEFERWGKNEAANFEGLTLRKETDGTFALVLVAFDEERRLADPDCRALLRAALVVLAARGAVVSETVDSPELIPSAASSGSLSEGRPSESPLSQEGSGGPSVERPVEEETESRPRHEERSRPRWMGFLVAGPIVGVGVAPTPAFGLEFGAGMGQGPVAVTVRLRYFLPSENLDAGGVGLWLDSIGARLGVRYAWFSWLHVELHGGASRYGARALGVTTPRFDDVVQPFLGLESSLFLWRDERWSLEAAVDARVGLTVPRFEFSDGTVVYQLERMSGAAQLRAGWLF